MIAQLKGQVLNISGRNVVLDVSGVGYEVFCSSLCLERLVIGSEASIIIYTDVKEDSIRLFGFNDQLEKQVFSLITRVRGLGAKTASDILSRIEKKELLRAIGLADIAKLQSIKGIGKKIAERLVVELKDKVLEFVEESNSRLNLETIVSEPFADAVQALLALGFPRKDAERAVKEVELQNGTGKIESADIVRNALRFV